VVPIVMEQSFVAVLGGEALSVTWMVKLYVPLSVGVPEIVHAVRVSPGGRLPLVIEQV
jgi:hypothetical protein